MKFLLVLCAVVGVAVCRPETYDPKFDSFDANELASNVRLLNNYAKCFLSKGPCTSEGTEFKKRIPEALQTTCAKCTPKQKELIRIVVRAMQEKLPELWDELRKKNDPQSKYRESFEAFLNSRD